MHRTVYSVDEDSDGFVIRTQWAFATWEAWLGTIVLAAFVWIFSHGFHAPVWLSYCLAAVAAGIQVFRSIGAHDTCTTITKFEARPTGDFPDGYKPAVFVPLANIIYLTYREKESRGEDETLPAGLWAELEQGSVCLVPQLTKEEADALILRIEDRFRHVIGSAIAPGGRRAGDLITLGLNTNS